MKTTNEGWPDPTEWVNRLANALQERGEAYHSAEELHVKQVQMAGLINAIVSHLSELPAVGENDLALPLMHVVDAFLQASEGHKPTLFTNRRSNPTRKASIYWMSAKSWAIVVFYTLRDAGHPAPEDIVAREMNKQRLSRRSNERQTPKSILGFVREFEDYGLAPDAPVYVTNAREKLAAFRSDPRWPVDEQAALRFARESFRSSRLRPFYS